VESSDVRLEVVFAEKPPSALDASLLLLRRAEDARRGEPRWGAYPVQALRNRLQRGVSPAMVTGEPDIWACAFAKAEQTVWGDWERARKAGEAAWDTALRQQWKSVWVESIGTEETMEAAFLEGLYLSAYRFSRHSTPSDAPMLQAFFSEASRQTLQTRLEWLRGQAWTRDLVNLPPDVLNAEAFSEALQKTLTPLHISVEVFRKHQLQALRMGGLLAVNRGSLTEPTFNVLEWNPHNSTAPPLVLVGKGVTYDSGGLNLKSGEPMGWMKSDMAGAAAVAGVFWAAARTRLPERLIGLIPATDNRPGQHAMAPGDVVTTYSGTTVEVLNTDAEGRLILADALHYAKRYKPQLVIDLATLTGSAVRALGDKGAVYFSTADGPWNQWLEESGHEAYERVHRFPLWEEYGDDLRSHVADLKNVGPPEAGAITAAKFLEHFVHYPWMHLDIAGMAFRPQGQGYRGTGGSGFGVRLLLHFLQKFYQKT
jgi:leucyl aminopeptidase